MLNYYSPLPGDIDLQIWQELHFTRQFIHFFESPFKFLRSEMSPFQDGTLRLNLVRLFFCGKNVAGEQNLFSCHSRAAHFNDFVLLGGLIRVQARWANQQQLTRTHLFWICSFQFFPIICYLTLNLICFLKLRWKHSHDVSLPLKLVNFLFWFGFFLKQWNKRTQNFTFYTSSDDICVC